LANDVTLMECWTCPYHSSRKKTWTFHRSYE